MSLATVSKELTMHFSSYLRGTTLHKGRLEVCMLSLRFSVGENKTIICHSLI